MDSPKKLLLFVLIAFVLRPALLNNSLIIIVVNHLTFVDVCFFVLQFKSPWWVKTAKVLQHSAFRRSLAFQMGLRLNGMVSRSI